MMSTRPQTIGYGLKDSSTGLAAFMLDQDPRSYEQISQLFAGHPFGDLIRDDILDNITLYWPTNSATSAARMYWDNGGRSVLVCRRAEDDWDQASFDARQRSANCGSLVEMKGEPTVRWWHLLM